MGVRRSVRLSEQKPTGHFLLRNITRHIKLMYSAKRPVYVHKNEQKNKTCPNWLDTEWFSASVSGNMQPSPSHNSSSDPTCVHSTRGCIHESRIADLSACLPQADRSQERGYIVHVPEIETIIPHDPIQVRNPSRGRWCPVRIRSVACGRVQACQGFVRKSRVG